MLDMHDFSAKHTRGVPVLGGLIQLQESNHISKIEKLLNIHIEIIIYYLKQKSEFKSSFKQPDYLSGTAMLTFFPVLDNLFLVRSSSKDENILSVSVLQVFVNPNKILDWKTNRNLILLTNI